MVTPRSSLRTLAGRLLRALPPRIQCAVVSWRSRGRVECGEHAFIHRSVQILGRSSVAVGHNSVVAQDCWLNVNHRDTDAKSIVIGDNCFIGRRNFFSSGRVIILKDFVLTANDCHFLGSTHVTDDPMRPVIATGTTASDSIVVGTNTFIGAGARLVGDITVGHGCIVAAGSTVTKSVPPFSQVVGNPATARKRYSVICRAWVPLADFTAEDERALPSEFDYLQMLMRHPAIPMPYIAAGSDLGNC